MPRELRELMVDQVQRLCRAAQQGDERAASELLKLCHQRTYSYLRRLCDNDQDAEDLTQETFAKVWLSLSDYQGRCAFLTWVHRIAHNAYVDWRRKRKSVACVSNAWWGKALDRNPGPFENAAGRHLAERVYALVDRLDEGKKQVVHLHYYQGLSLRDTAYALNIAASTVKYRVREALRFLRSHVDREERFCDRK